MYYMQEDDIILSQQYCCVSWVEPISLRNQQVSNQLFNFFKGHVETPENLSFSKVLEDYLDYKEMYYKEHVDKHDCAVPYIKIRGAYKTQEQCVQRIKQLEDKYKDNEPVPIYCGYVGKWFPFMFNQKSAEDPLLNTLLNKALWDYTEHIEENNNEFLRHQKKTEEVYERKPFNEEYDYLSEDELIDRYQYFCISFFEPKDKVAKELENDFIRNFIYFFLSEEFKARYSKKGITENVPSFNSNKEDLFLKFQEESVQDTNTNFENNGWPCLKLRGVYASVEEAQKRAELLQKVDKHFRVDVCKVGGWLPFHPPAHLLKSFYGDPEQDNILGALNEKINPEVVKNLQELEKIKKNVSFVEDDSNVEVL